MCKDKVSNLESEVSILKSEMAELCKWGRDKGTWINDDTESRYFAVQRKMNEKRNELYAVRDEIRQSNESQQSQKSGLEIMREKAAAREAVITSSTYERAQKRLFKQVDGFLCGRGVL